MKTYIYIHIATVNNWESILFDLLWKIKDSNLYDEIDEIRCGILGDKGNSKLFNLPKIKIIGESDDLSLYESFTINLLHDDALNAEEEFNVLYIHTKGSKHDGNNINVLDWVKYLCYFNIYKYKTCFKYLHSHDSVGVNLQESRGSLHYSGNFWWSKSSYIKRLEKCKREKYNDPEFWLTEKRIGNYVNLWLSHVTDHYTERYTYDKYIK